MNKKRKTMLAAAVCLAISGSCYAAENGTVTALGEDPDLQLFHLAEVVVSGRRYIAGEYVRAVSNVGILGKQDVMHSPISTTTISEKAVEDFMSSTEGLSKMLSLVPSVQKTYDAAVDCINIRGFSDSGRGFMVNGIPGMQAMTRQSTNYIDSVDVIEGPATGIKGSGNYVTAGGTININSKKAEEDPNTNIGLKWHSKGAFEQSVDIGHRFGKDNRFGVRVNAYSTNGERSIKNWDLEQRNVYVNLDQKNDRSNTLGCQDICYTPEFEKYSVTTWFGLLNARDVLAVPL